MSITSNQKTIRIREYIYRCTFWTDMYATEKGYTVMPIFFFFFSQKFKMFDCDIQIIILAPKKTSRLKAAWHFSGIYRQGWIQEIGMGWGGGGGGGVLRATLQVKSPPPPPQKKTHTPWFIITQQKGTCKIMQDCARILQESCMQDLLGTCTRYVHDSCTILHISCKKCARFCKSCCKNERHQWC